MSMRLMPKSEVNIAKAKAERQLADEGLQLARRVDNLREVAADEEASLETFRARTLKSIHDDITKKTEERDLLEAGNGKLRQERERLQKPLDEEWEAVAAASKEVQECKKILKAREDAVSQSELSLLSARKEHDTVRREADTARGSANRLRDDAERDAKKAELALSAANRAESEALALRTGAQKDAERRSKGLDEREDLLNKQAATLKAEREAINREKRLLADRRRTLEKHLIKSQD